MMMTRAEADAIAVLVHHLRPDWDIRGVMAALAQCATREAGPVALASVRAAMTESNRTPAVIPMAGAHWAGERVTSPAPLSLNALCERHKRDPRTCPWCTGKLPDDPEEP